MTILTILSGLWGEILGFAAAGLGAATILESAFGSRDGGPAMSGFFGFGPIGAVAGLLLGAGLAVRFGKKSLKWCRGLLISGGMVTASGALLLAIVSTPDRQPSYANVIEFELEYPAATLAGIEIPNANTMWGAAGADTDDQLISQLFQERCAGDVCVLDGSVAALGAMNNFRIAASLGPKQHRYPLNLPAAITGPVDWSAWRDREGARIRWRIVKHYWASAVCSQQRSDLGFLGRQQLIYTPIFQ